MAIETNFQYLESFFKVLGDICRLQIIEFLKGGERNLKDIQEYLDKSQSTVSQHLKMLVDANILSYRKEGTKKFYVVKTTEIYELLVVVDAMTRKIEREKVRNISSASIKGTLS